MRHRGVRRFVVLIASTAAGLLPALAEEPKKDEPKKEPRNQLLLEAVVTDARPGRTESIVVLMGEAHVVFESLGKGNGPASKKNQQFLDVRAENAVAFTPPAAAIQKDGAPPIRALYAEGHVRLAQQIGTTPPFIIEADKLYVDLVAERAYAIDATVRAPGSTKPQPTVGPNPRTTPKSAATITLRAHKLRLEGTGSLVAEDGALSACDFGLPHEALEATRITIVQARPRKTPSALTAAAALGDLGATAIAHRAERDRPFRAFRDIMRHRAEPREGSDALLHAAEAPRFVEVEEPGARIRPPYTGEEGFGVPLPFPVGWETDWPFPDLRIGHSSKWGWYELAKIKVPLLHADVLHDSEDRHVREGADVTLQGGGGFYETRGGTGDLGAVYDYFAQGERILRGEVDGTYIHDRQLFDRNGSIIPDDERYWIHGVHQEELPLGVHLDAEFSRQSDRNYLLEWERSVALTQKEQETYVYLRRSWDDFGARFDARFRLNDFQSQVEDLPRARADWILTPVFAQPVLGGLYFTTGVEAAYFRRRFDDFLSITPLPDQKLAREDVVGRLDYKLSILDKIYVRAYGEGRFTDWSERQLPDGTTNHDSIERFLGTVGARAGTQFDAPFVLTDSGLTLRHVLIPEAGYEDRILDTRDPSTLVQLDETETYRPGSYFYARVRNRLQWADNPRGTGAHDLLDLTIEGRYFPTDERLDLGQRKWGTIYADGRLYMGTEGTLRGVCELDPNRHRLIRLDATASWLASRSVGKWLGDAERLYPDISFDVGYHELADISRAVGYAIDVRLTPSWGARFEELYDLDQRTFLEHRLIVRRYFHGFALELSGSWNPILHDTSISFSVIPFFEGDEPVTRPPLDFGD